MIVIKSISQKIYKFHFKGAKQKKIPTVINDFSFFVGYDKSFF